MQPVAGGVAPGRGPTGTLLLRARVALTFLARVAPLLM